MILRKLLPRISNEVCTILQAKPDRALILLYDLKDTKFLLGVVVDRNHPDNAIRTNIAPCVWRALEWGESKLNDPPLVCQMCSHDKENGWFFQQSQVITFFCTGCFQGN